MSRDLFKTSPEETGPTEKQLLEKEIKDLQVHRDKERVPVSDSIKEKFALFKVFIF
jgi:predicted RNA-binding protein Jag